MFSFTNVFNVELHKTLNIVSNQTKSFHRTENFKVANYGKLNLNLQLFMGLYSVLWEIYYLSFFLAIPLLQFVIKAGNCAHHRKKENLYCTILYNPPFFLLELECMYKDIYIFCNICSMYSMFLLLLHLLIVNFLAKY